MDFTSHLPAGERDRVEARLRHNLMAWLTTVRPDGQPVSVPVWFLAREGTILVYSEPGKAKLRHVAANPRVSLTLDGTDIGRNIVRIEGVAEPGAAAEPPAHEQPAYVAKYLERIDALFGTPERFGERFSAALIITPTRLHT